MHHIEDLYLLFRQALKDRVQPLYEPLIQEGIIHSIEFDQEVERYYKNRRPGLQDVYSRFAPEWEQFSILRELPDSRFYYQLQLFVTAFAKYYRPEQLGLDYYLHQLRNNERKSAEWQLARQQLMDRWQRCLTDREFNYRMGYINRLCDDYYRITAQNLGQLRNRDRGGRGNIGRMEWLMPHVDPKLRKRIHDLLPILRRNPIVRELEQVLGRDTSQSAQRVRAIASQRFSHEVMRASHMDIVGVRSGGGVQGLLPQEYAMMGDSRLEPLFYSRMIDGQLQQFDLQSPQREHVRPSDEAGRDIADPRGEGPFVVCVDCSSSMAGSFEEIAKALVVTVATMAERKHRRCQVVMFSNQISHVEINDLWSDLPLLEDFLTQTFHGGTEVEPALCYALEQLGTEDYRMGDLVLLSDCDMRQPDDVLYRQIEQLRDRGLHWYTVAFGSNANDYFSAVSDKFWTYQ